MTTNRPSEERLAALESESESVVSRLDKIEKSIERIADQIALIRLPNVSVWISAAGLAVTVSGLFVTIGLAIGGVVLSGYARDMVRMEGYFRERADQNLSGVAALDKTLQREMRLINKTTEQSVEDLDRRLQHEIRQQAEINHAERRTAIRELEVKLLRRKP